MSIRFCILRRCLAVACAFALVSCGDSETTSSTTTPATTATSPSTAPVTTATSPSTAPVTTGAAGSCSAARETPAVAAQPGLPPAVAAMRADLARAVAACDWATIGGLVDRDGAGVHFTFGGPGDPIAAWQRAERSGQQPAPLLAIRRLLDLPFASQPLPATTQYVWPAAHVAVPPSTAQLRAIADAGLYPMATLEEWVRSGHNYLGYRLAITASGDWTFFVAGD